MRRRTHGTAGSVMAYGTNARRVFASWDRAIEVALAYGFQTGWKHKVRQVAARDAGLGVGPVYRVERTKVRVRRRCNPRRERELGRHST